eukprot:CAMPEP_0173256894 /NCGR_PEP_ID=MMETSP1142-20121109/23444_1 /TAXON_ID=483371 /ORGANISM="non described non described, Strain CCMP2298" /LENGTH=191 /DNA_ID=CAMNT_0014190915 /DNA_START=40 /DNA_END=612 /DNA_ORIENTATION=+
MNSTYLNSANTGNSANSAHSANATVAMLALEGIRRGKDRAQARRDSELREFNRRHFVKGTEEKRPFSPTLFTETHRIMSTLSGTFQSRTHSACEDFLMRRELSTRFPAPGPGQYKVDAVPSLDVGSPLVQRSRSLSPVPGHGGYSFGRELLYRAAERRSPSPTAVNPFHTGVRSSHSPTTSHHTPHSPHSH